MANQQPNHVRRREALSALREVESSTVFRAHHRWARMSAHKVRLDADKVRGLPITTALEQLQFSNRRGAALLDKVVRSALANAEYRISEKKLDLDVDTLYVADIQVGRGPYLKRWMTRARGMAYPIQKNTCHISVALRIIPQEQGGAEAEGADAAKAASTGTPGKKGKAGKAAKGKKRKQTAAALA